MVKIHIIGGPSSGIAVPPTEAFVQQYLERYKEKVFLVKNTVDRTHLFELLTNR